MIDIDSQYQTYDIIGPRYDIGYESYDIIAKTLISWLNKL